MVMSVQKLVFSKIYATPPRDMNDLIQRITQEADAIKQNPQLVRRAEGRKSIKHHVH